MSFDKVDCVVAGAGVVGLAVARELARRGREVIVIEKAASIGSGTSSRNSEVVHAGIYYPANSAKARLCVEGRDRLYAYCETHKVPYRKLGKLITASDETQAGELDAIRRRAEANGVDDIRLLDGRQAEAEQPGLKSSAALLSPSTGIVDSHAFMVALEGDAEAAGAMIAFRTDVAGVEPVDGGYLVRTQGEEPFEIVAESFVNSAGLGAPALARRIEGLAPGLVPNPYFAKGNYFRLAMRSPFSRLIYPVPEPGGLGVHITMDLGGQARFGPDVEWIDGEDYSVDAARGDSFYAAIRKYWPGLPDGALEPDYCGIRPKISPSGDPAADFVISDERAHGLPGLVNLFGIESPGLTAALAIANDVAERLR